MKKILLLLLFLFIPKVDALTYSDYSDFSEFSDKQIENSPLVDVVTEKRYKYYKLNREDGPYLMAGTNSNYAYIDYNDYILSDFSPVLYEKPDETNRVITSKTEYKYQRVSPVNYLQINLAKTSPRIQIKSLKIYQKDKEITDYDIIGYYTSFEVATASGPISPNGWIKIRLHDNYYLDELKITLELEGSYNNIEYTYTAGYDDVVYMSNDFKYQNTDNLKTEFLFKNSSLKNPKFEYFYDNDREESNVLKKTSETRTIYRYQDKLYRHYNLEKIYNDKYTKEPDGDFIYKDNNDYKIYYAYRTRSIIETDNLTANNFIQPKRSLKEPLNNNEVKNINDSNKKTLTSNSSDNYQRPLEKTEYQKANIIDNYSNENNNLIYLIYFLIFFILSIIILLLSKCYKSKINCGKV